MVQNIQSVVEKGHFNNDSVINTMLYALSVQKGQKTAARSYLLQDAYSFDIRIRPYASDLLDRFRDLEYIMSIARKTNITEIELKRAKTKLAFIQREIDEESHYKKLKLSQNYKSRVLVDENIRNNLDKAIANRTKDLATLREVLVPQEDMGKEVYEMLQKAAADTGQKSDTAYTSEPYQPLWTNLRYKRTGKGSLLKIKTELEFRLREYTEEVSEIAREYDINKHIINTIEFQLDSKYLTVRQGNKKNGNIIPLQENYGCSEGYNPNIRHYRSTTDDRIHLMDNNYDKPDNGRNVNGGAYTLLKGFARNFFEYMASFGGRFKH